MNTQLSSGEEKLKIFLVEDDTRLSALIQEYLQKQDIDVSVEHRGDRACKRILGEDHDLVILDLMLPGMDGLEICKAVRQQFTGRESPTKIFVRWVAGRAGPSPRIRTLPGRRRTAGSKLWCI